MTSKQKNGSGGGVGQVFHDLVDQTRDFFIAIKPHKYQFGLAMLLTAMVGGSLRLAAFPQGLMAGTDEKNEFFVESFVGSFAFLATFGFAKAVANLAVGILADRYGRKLPHNVGWVFSIVVPIMVIVATNWATVVSANIFLGIAQGLSWSVLIFIMVDYAGPANRGVAIGINETMGYVSTALFNLVAAAMIDEEEKNYREGPYYTLLAFSLVALFIGVFLLKETKQLVYQEQSEASGREIDENSEKSVLIQWTSGTETRASFERMGFATTSLLNTSLAVMCFAGLVVNMMVALAWGLFLSWMRAGHPDGNWDGFTSDEIAQATLAYGIVRGILQFITGFTSDVYGRKNILISGFSICTVALMCLAITGEFVVGDDAMFTCFIVFGILMGVGIALVYPTLLAAVCDHADPVWRASALGTYRFWRDIGVAVGAMISGGINDWTGEYAYTVGFFACFVALTVFLIYMFYEERMPSTAAEQIEEGGDVEVVAKKQLVDADDSEDSGVVKKTKASASNTNSEDSISDSLAGGDIHVDV